MDGSAILPNQYSLVECGITTVNRNSGRARFQPKMAQFTLPPFRVDDPKLPQRAALLCSDGLPVITIAAL